MMSGIKRVMASVQALAALNDIYRGAPVPLATLSQQSKLSVSYLEQIFQKLRTSGLVISHRGPGGGYELRDPDISVSEVIRAVSCITENKTFTPVLDALDSVLVSQLTSENRSTR